jgi:RNA polymerase sigma-70 factor (ECF subfamily)
MATAAPRLLDRPAQLYLGVRRFVTMETIGHIADAIPELLAELERQGVRPDGAPFLRYLTIDMARELEVEAGVPIAAPVHPVDDHVVRALPAGRYVTVTHVGSPDGLVDATAGLLRWADEEGLAWDVHDTPRGRAWGCRLEVYRTDPRVEPDVGNWETDLVFKLATVPES